MSLRFFVGVAGIIGQPGMDVPEVQGEPGSYGRGVACGVRRIHQQVCPDLLRNSLEFSRVGIVGFLFQPYMVGRPD